MMRIKALNTGIIQVWTLIIYQQKSPFIISGTGWGKRNRKRLLNFLVKIFSIVGIITGRILCTDGTLIDTFARYRGCTYMEKCCTCLSCPANVINDINGAIENTVKEMERKEKISMIATVKMQCPREEIRKKLIE
jgi:hypothetical protein